MWWRNNVSIGSNYSETLGGGGDKKVWRFSIHPLLIERWGG